MSEEIQYRKIIYYKHYFNDFYNGLDDKVQAKIIQVFIHIQEDKIINTKFLKLIQGQKGLYEIRIRYSQNIYRFFCCFDQDKLVVLFNGFTKKTQKTPPNEIKKAIGLMNEYFNTKDK